MARGLGASSSADAARGQLVRARLSPSGSLVLVADGDLLYLSTGAWRGRLRVGVAFLRRALSLSGQARSPLDALGA